MLMMPMRSAPKNMPTTAPFPPLNDTPPIAQAAMASVSNALPAVGCAEAFLADSMTPARAAQIPLIM